MSDQPLRIYICHDPEESALADRLDAWTRVNDDRAWYDQRVTLPPADPTAAAVRDRLRTWLAEADACVCILSRTTFANPWIDWEIEQARTGGKRVPLVAILVYEHVRRPVGLTDSGAVFVPFKRDSIETAIAWAVEHRHTSDEFTLADE